MKSILSFFEIRFAHFPGHFFQGIRGPTKHRKSVLIELYLYRLLYLLFIYARLVAFLFFFRSLQTIGRQAVEPPFGVAFLVALFFRGNLTSERSLYTLPNEPLYTPKLNFYPLPNRASIYPEQRLYFTQLAPLFCKNSASISFRIQLFLLYLPLK